MTTASHPVTTNAGALAATVTTSVEEDIAAVMEGTGPPQGCTEGPRGTTTEVGTGELRAATSRAAVVTVEEALQAMEEAVGCTIIAPADMAAVMRNACADTADGTTEAIREKSDVTVLRVEAAADTEQEQAAPETAVSAVATTVDMAAAVFLAAMEE